MWLIMKLRKRALKNMKAKNIETWTEYHEPHSGGLDDLRTEQSLDRPAEDPAAPPDARCKAQIC